MSARLGGKASLSMALDALPSDECVLWLGWCTNYGYGRLKHAGQKVYAHRHMYELLVGPIPDGLVIDHLCRTPCCVNPAHMEPVSIVENTARGRAVRMLHGDDPRTHCIYGHPMDAENTYFRTYGGRSCRACDRRRGRAYEARRKAERAVIA